MPVIDAHQHFWKYHPDTHHWISDEMAVIRKDFLPADLAPVLKQHGVDGCIAVQADQSEAETDFLVSLANENDWIKGVVGWVDLCADNIRERLQYYCQFPVVKGFRHILQAEDPAFMLKPEFLRGIGALQEYGFAYDILVYPRHLPAVQQLVKQFPDQRFVIDHIAKPAISKGVMEEWVKNIQAIAIFPNLYCKVSGMVTEANWSCWKKEDLYPYLDMVTESFGADRLLYGSDWPVCLLAASYERMMEPVKEYYSNFSATEQAALFGGNAAAFYHV